LEPVLNPAEHEMDEAPDDRSSSETDDGETDARTESATLVDALAVHEIEIESSCIAPLEAYCKLLWDWNEKINLTRHVSYDAFVARDLVDSIQLANLLAEGEEVLDFGSGGGVPGIPLAILRPDLDVTLCESVGKKAKVLESMAKELDLSMGVYNERAEKLLDDFRYDVLTARAVGPLWKICTWFQPHWHSIGRLLAIKGPRWPDERGEARHRGVLHGVEMRCVAKYPMWGTESESVILKLWQAGRPELG